MKICVCCVYVKRITLCNCLCSSSCCCFSASIIRYIGEFGPKNYFRDHQTANTIHGFINSVPVYRIYDLLGYAKILATFHSYPNYNG